MHSLTAIALVAEGKIKEAQEEGAFDNLPGSGKPLALEDNAHIPPEYRMAYAILKNSGYIEPLPQNAPAPAANIRAALCQEAPEEHHTHSKLQKLRLFLARRAKKESASPATPGQAFPLCPAALTLEESPYREQLLGKL